MNTATVTAAADALDRLGSLYRNADGVEVWAIRDLNGAIVADNIEPDFDAAFVAARQMGVSA